MLALGALRRTPTARTSWASATRGSTACARASGSSTACCSAALALVLAGIALGAYVVGTWVAHGFGSLGEERLAVVAATLIIVGIQIFFTSFLVSLLGLRRQQA